MIIQISFIGLTFFSLIQTNQGLVNNISSLIPEYNSEAIFFIHKIDTVLDFIFNVVTFLVCLNVDTKVLSGTVPVLNIKLNLNDEK